MGEIIVPNAVERKAGYLYYIDGEGNLCEAKLSRSSKNILDKNTKEDNQNGKHNS